MNQNNIKVSIIMPIYNQEQFIEKCLLSVCAQTLKDIEIIVVNDGSTDSSMDIVKRIAKKDKRIFIIDKANSGYGNSVNRGMKQAKGEYIGIVETDDFIAPEMYEKLYNLTNDGKIDIVKGNFYDYYQQQDGTEEFFVNHERDSVIKEKICNVRTEPQILWGHPSVWSAIYKREMLEENDIWFIEAKGGGWVDNPFFFDTLFHADSYIWTDEPFYYYRKTNANSSSNSIGNPVLPFERMIDNLNVAEKNGFNDVETLKFLYARALMYMTGAYKECDYGNNFEIIDRYAEKLMRKCNSDVFDTEFNTIDRFLYYTNASPVKTMLYDCPKILIYNWVPFDNPERKGGGVTVYCRNLIDTILKESPSTQVYFLSSGYAYDARRTDIYVRHIDSEFGEHVRQFEVVNSPVPADQWLLYRNPTVALQNDKLKETIKKFIDKFGSFKVIHFNNIEGLSLDVMDLKADYPDTRFIYSIHNYNAMCMTGFYYQRHNHCICNPNHTAEDCFACSRVNIGKEIVKIVYQRGSYGNVVDELVPMDIWSKELGLEAIDKDAKPDSLIEFASVAIKKINENCDHILAVSKRVLDIAIENGFDKNKTTVSYIGTLVARSQVGRSIAKPKDGLKIVFLGNDLNYEEKGYPFLLSALSRLDESYAQKLDVVLTTRSQNKEIIYDSLGRFRSVKVYNGYTHNDLKKILDDCDISIVPVLWEDNLPQIAIESVAYGVPVLASDAGGASELCDSDVFRFRHGDTEDFLRKLIFLLDNPQKINDFWLHHAGLVTLKEHWKELNEKYYGIEDKKITLEKEDLSFLLQENTFLKTYFGKNENDVEWIANKCFNREERRLALQVFVENEELIRINKELGLAPDSIYFKVIRKLNKLFPKGSRRRRFFKKFFQRKGR